MHIISAESVMADLRALGEIEFSPHYVSDDIVSDRMKTTLYQFVATGACILRLPKPNLTYNARYFSPMCEEQIARMERAEAVCDAWADICRMAQQRLRISEAYAATHQDERIRLPRR